MAKEKTVLVTGANRGIGLEACRQLARLGFSVILTARDEIKGRKAAQQLEQEGLRLRFEKLDVRDDDSIKELGRKLKDEGVHIDILINNAGIMPDRHLAVSNALEVPPAVLIQAFKTNSLGPYMLIQEFAPAMIKKNYGRIVNVSSGMGQLSDMNGGYPAYRISKTALNAVTRFFSEELKYYNIKVNSVCPGWVKTDMGGEGADRELADSVDTLIWLATLDDSGPTGGFFRDRQPIPW